jgi:hypothetical protein
VFKDDESIRSGVLWLERLQAAVEACESFVVLVGRDRGAALDRGRDPGRPEPLLRSPRRRPAPADLPDPARRHGSRDTPGLPAAVPGHALGWRGAPARGLLAQIRDRTLVASAALPFEGCPFVGLVAYRIDQAPLFFGRQKETLDALACFDTRSGSPRVRWLEINGNSGCGKSSLLNAGLLPLVDRGWLWPRTGIEHWRRIGSATAGTKKTTAAKRASRGSEI